MVSGEWKVAQPAAPFAIRYSPFASSLYSAAASACCCRSSTKSYFTS
jgi:hypothetical protein